jgi:hypothetical protein
MPETKDTQARPRLLIEYTDTRDNYGCLPFDEFADWFIHEDGTGRLVTKQRHYHMVKNVAEVEFRLREVARLEREYADAKRALARRIADLEVRVSELRYKAGITEVDEVREQFLDAEDLKAERRAEIAAGQS